MAWNDTYITYYKKTASKGSTEARLWTASLEIKSKIQQYLWVSKQNNNLILINIGIFHT